MIESVFTLIPTLAMLFLIVDIAFVVFMKGIFVHACREGVRWAITFSDTYAGSACVTQSACIKQVVQDNSLGFLRGSNTRFIEVNYFAPSDLATPLTAPNPLAVPPINYINQTGNVIEINVKNYPMTWMIPIPTFAPGVGMWLANPAFTLNATGADVLQGYPVGTTQPPAA